MDSPRTRWILLGAIIVHLMAAWSSSGFQNSDEHYQIVTFAEAKLGHQPVNELPWEYAAHIRSALLPAICWAVFSTAHAIGVDDPFTLTFLLRLLTAMLALGSTWYFVRSTWHLLEPRFQQAFMVLSFFLWFLPFLHVRYTGETWSGLFFLLGLASLLSPKEKTSRYWRTGIFLGLAFLCRPPVLMMSAGLVLWLVIIHKESRRNIFHLLVGMLAVLLLGIALDSWFYGSFTLTAWNYARLGVAGSADHSFPSFPWWYYFAWIVKYAVPLFGIPVLLAFGMLLVLRPKGILVWVIAPFLLLHIALPHKELRFLWPLADLVPLMLISAAGACLAKWPLKTEAFLQRSIMVPFRIFLVAINVAALSVVAFTPAGNGRARLAAQIREHWHGEAVHIRYLADDSTGWNVRIPSFYLPEGSTDTVLTSPCAPLPEREGRIELLVAMEPPSPCTSDIAGSWQEVASALPLYSEMLLHAYTWEDTKPCLKLFEAVPFAVP